MKPLSNKIQAFLISAFLLSTIGATIVALPSASAHYPAWTIPTWCYATTSPNPVGVNQQALIVFWTDKVPYTAVGAYGDRWTFTVDVAKPDGSKETLGPTTSDPVGGGYFVYTPTQTGTYSFVAKFPGATLTGNPVPPPPLTYQQGGGDYINDTYLPSESAPTTLVVQSTPVTAHTEPGLPTGYWTRPINVMNRGWWVIAGNWLGGPSPFNSFNQYTTAPGTSHIVWTKAAEMGGIVGGLQDISYYTGSAYEIYWTPPIIIGGKLYYNELAGPRYGFYCVDLRTGEQVWWQNSTGPVQIGSMTPAHISGTDIPWMYPRLSFGQVFDYESPNQHGALAYLWSTYTNPEAATYSYPIMNPDGRTYSTNSYSFTAAAGTTVWQMWDAFTGQYICSIANVPSGSMWMAKDGSILIYQYNSRGWMALWNSSQALAYPNVNNQHLTAGEAYYWMWRPPVGRTVDGSNGWMWNASVPVGGSIGVVADDIIVGSTGLVGFQYGTNAYGIFALNVKDYKPPTLIWQTNNAQPPIVNATVVLGPISPDDGVGTFMLKETMQWYGFDLNTGKVIWGPSAAQTSMDMYSMRSASAGRIAYGKLLSCGYGGIVYAYDVKTGESLWTSPLNAAGTEAPYANWPLGSGAGISIADHKIFVTTGEHSVTQPMYRDWSIYCFDTETGKNLWNTTGLMGTIALADGYAVCLDQMDLQIYNYGKGQTATTVTAAPKVTTQGSVVLIEGTVTDQSPGAKDTPAISDNDMTAWMEYLYKQQTMPTNAQGVTVKLSVFDPNKNTYDIGTATSNINGDYAFAWTPPVPGVYTITATFQGSGSYFASTEDTHIAVSTSGGSVPSPSVSPSPSEAPSPGSGALPTTYIAIAAAVIVIVAVAAALILRRHK
jgi:PQQ-like domain